MDLFSYKQNLIADAAVSKVSRRKNNRRSNLQFAHNAIEGRGWLHLFYAAGFVPQNRILRKTKIKYKKNDPIINLAQTS